MYILLRLEVHLDRIDNVLDQPNDQHIVLLDMKIPWILAWLLVFQMVVLIVESYTIDWIIALLDIVLLRTSEHHQF